MLTCTKEIIQRTERLTGKPVHMEEDRSLPVISHIQIARGPVPMHKLRYRPIPDGTPDYFICFQCGFIIRLYENPPEQRYDFEGSPDAPARMTSLLKGNPAASQMRDMLLGGLMTQLRSMPIGMRIDDWLFHEYPELRLQQVAGAKVQLRDNSRALSELSATLRSAVRLIRIGPPKTMAGDAPSPDPNLKVNRRLSFIVRLTESCYDGRVLLGRVSGEHCGF